MAFDPARPDRALLDRVPFGDEWLALADPADGGACDPLRASSRLAMYRSLIERGNPAGALGAHDELSPFWGYAAQLAWQRRSGRLATDAGDAIDAASWWGACNYALSVVPYLAGADAGVVPRLELPPPPRWYAAARAAWRDALVAMRRLGRGDDLDGLRVAIWRAHLTSIEAAVGAHADQHRALPAAERGFARGWVRMVELFGAAGWRTDLARLAAQGGGHLPSRVLDGERDRELPPAERATVRRVTALGARPAWRWRLETRAWQRMMRTPAARADAEVILGALFGRGRDTWPVRARALWLVI